MRRRWTMTRQCLVPISDLIVMRKRKQTKNWNGHSNQNRISSFKNAHGHRNSKIKRLSTPPTPPSPFLYLLFCFLSCSSPAVPPFSGLTGAGASQDGTTVKPTKDQIRHREFKKCGGIPVLHARLYRGVGRGWESAKSCWGRGDVSWGGWKRGSRDVGGTVSSTAREEWIILPLGICCGWGDIDGKCCEWYQERRKESITFYMCYFAFRIH